MADAASIAVTATVLPDEIQKVLTVATTIVTPQNSTEKWYYGLRNVTNSSADLIAGNFLMTAAGVATGSSEAAVHVNDKVRFVFIKNTGTTNGSSTTTEAINICFDGGTAAFNLVDGIEIGPGEAWYGKLPNTTVANLHAASVDTNMGDAGSAGEGNVQCIVAAILDDVA